MISAHSETLASNNLPFTADDYTVRLGGADCSVWGSCQRIQAGTRTRMWMYLPDKDPKKLRVKSGAIQTQHMFISNIFWINGERLFVQQWGHALGWKLKLKLGGEADLNKMEISVVQQLTEARRKRQKLNVKQVRMNGGDAANTGFFSTNWRWSFKFPSAAAC